MAAQPSRKPRPRPLWRFLIVRVVDCVLVLFFLSLAYAAVLRFAPVPGTFLMVERAVAGEQIRRNPVPLDKISPHVVRAVIAAEDSRFCTHWGIEPESIRAAARFNSTTGEKKGKLRGGSTISQQTAKNVFLWPTRSWLRKGLEAWFTIAIEALWPKRRIMEAYLNAIEFGDGIFGIEAAARARFGKSAADLSRREAAALAAILPAPNKWNAVSPGPWTRKRIATILQRMTIVSRDGLARCALPQAPRTKTGGKA